MKGMKKLWIHLLATAQVQYVVVQLRYSFTEVFLRHLIAAEDTEREGKIH
jgi:hypothetical protein